MAEYGYGVCDNTDDKAGCHLMWRKIDQYILLSSLFILVIMLFSLAETYLYLEISLRSILHDFRSIVASASAIDDSGAIPIHDAPREQEANGID